jgi:hypothetical protein
MDCLESESKYPLFVINRMVLIIWLSTGVTNQRRIFRDVFIVTPLMLIYPVTRNDILHIF